MAKTGQKLWGEILSEVRLQVSHSTFKTWFAGSYVVNFKESEGRELLVVGVKNNFLKEQVESRYEQLISEIKNEKGHENTEIIFVVSGNGEVTESKKEPLFSGKPQNYNFALRRAEVLNPNFTFENLVAGSSNSLAYMAATQVANNLGSAYNPLLVWGPTGVGKTHLLQAIGNSAVDSGIDVKVLYATCEKFTNDFIRSLKERASEPFRQKYRGVDILLADDIQFLAGKESTQDEFFHCFNELMLSGKQVIVASDRHPRELGRIKERLISRFLGGLVVDIGYPDVEMKMAIVKTKCKQRQVYIDDEVVSFIAQESHGGARELEGVLTSTLAQIKISGSKFSLEEVKTLLLKNRLSSQSLPTPRRVSSIVCKHYRVDEAEIRSESRKANLVRARQILMYLLRQDVGLSFEAIGEIVGGRDHSTVIHGVERVNKSLLENVGLKDEILRLREVIHKNH